MKRVLVRVAPAVVVLCLIAVTTGFVVSAESEANRAGRLDHDAASMHQRTRALQVQTAAVSRRALSAEQLQRRLEADAKVLETLDVAPMYSYGQAIDALNTLTSAVGAFVHAGSVGNAHAELDALLRDAREKANVFETDVLAFAANRDEFRSAVRAARTR